MSTPERVLPELTVGQTNERDFELRDLLRMLRRRRAIALGVPAAIVLLGAAVTLRSEKIYSATAKVIIEQSAPEVLSGVREVYSLGTQTYWAGEEYMRTQFEIIKSRPVAERVAASLGLVPAEMSKQLKEFPVSSSTDALAGLPEGMVQKIKILGLDRLGSRERILKALEDIDITSMIASRIHVVPGKSRVVGISVHDRVPENAALLANAVLAAYIEYNSVPRSAATREAVDQLSGKLQDLKSKLDSSDAALYDFMRENKVLNLSLADQKQALSQKMSSLNTSLAETLALRLKLESQREQLKAALAEGQMGDALSVMSGNELIQELRSTYAKLRQEESDLAQKYTESHPKLLAIREKLSIAEKDLRGEVAKSLSSLETDYKTALGTEQRLTNELKKIEDEGLALGERERRYNALLRARDNDQTVYELVIRRQKEADLSQSLNLNNIREHEKALVPVIPIKPNVRLNMLLALFVGLVLGIAAAFVVDYLDNTLKSQEQVEQILNLPFLGIVPAIKIDKAKLPLDPTERDHYILKHPRSSVAECTRTIRTNLMFMSADKPTRTLLVTSTGPREGKSTTAISLAYTMCQSGARTLIVDTDMRRPRLHKTFKVGNEAGLSNLILGDVPIEKAIRSTGVDKLDILPCGPIPPNPAELLHTEAFHELVKTFSNRYDRVIFDSPPVTAVADALVLTGLVDGTVLIVNCGRTAWPAAVVARKRLEGVGAKIYGVILNNVDLDAAKADDYYQYYYYYRSGYGTEEDKASV